MSFISRDLYLEVLGDGLGNSRQPLYADYYKPLAPGSGNLQGSQSQSISAADAVFSPKKRLPFKSVIKSFHRKVSGESFAEYDYYDNLSIKELQPQPRPQSQSYPHSQSQSYPHSHSQQPATHDDPTVQIRSSDPHPYRNLQRFSVESQEAREPREPQASQGLMKETIIQSQASRPSPNPTPRILASPSNISPSKVRTTKKSPGPSLFQSYSKRSSNPEPLIVPSKKSQAPSISPSIPPSYRTQDLDAHESTPRFDALPLQEPADWDMNDYTPIKKGNKIKNLFKRHDADSDAHSSWWVTVSPRAKLPEKMNTSMVPAIEHYRQKSEQMLMRWQRPKGPQITEICESNNEHEPREFAIAEKTFERQMRIFSHVNAIIKRVKIMRIIFSPIDTVAEQFPSLQSIVVIVEIVIFAWILYEVSLLVDALCMTVKAVCAPIIAIGKLMNRIM